MLLGIYLDSYLFVVSTSILQVGIGLNNNLAACSYTPPMPANLIRQSGNIHVYRLLLLFEGFSNCVNAVVNV